MKELSKHIDLKQNRWVLSFYERVLSSCIERLSGA